jgi:GAF domain-containing protein
MTVRNIAIIGANKEGLKLLPILLKDANTRVSLIVDPNKDSMLFKLSELGYSLAGKLGIKVTNNLDDIKDVEGLDVIVNALQSPEVDKFLAAPAFRDIEKLGPLSTRLIWGVKASTKGLTDGVVGVNEQTTLLASFREIVDAVRLTIDRKELLSVILKLATESTAAERGSIMLISAEERMLRVEIAKGMDEEVVRKIRVPLGDGISGKVAENGKPLLISGKVSSANFSRPMDRCDVKSSMCVPLVVKAEIIGVINVNSNESNHIFTEDDLNFLMSLAGLAAEVIQRSNEYETLKVEAAKFSFWKEIDGIISSPLPLEKRLNVVARKLAGIVPGLTCFIYLYDEDTKKLFLKASSIKDAKGLGLLSLRAGEGIEALTLDAVDDVVLVDRTETASMKRVYLSLPMLVNGHRVGTFNAQVMSAQGLTKQHEAFLKDIRTLIAENVYKFTRSEADKLKSHRMFAADEAGLEMISINDIKRLAIIIATTPAAIIGAEGSLLRLKHDASNKFRTAATFGLDDKSIREYFLPVERETVMEVLRTKRAASREISEEVNVYIRSVLSIPLVVDEVVIGVLTFFNKTTEAYVYPCPFSEADAKIVSRFGVYAEKALSRVMVNLAPEAAKPPLKSEPAPAEPPSAPAAQEEDGFIGSVDPNKMTPIKSFEARVDQELNRARRFAKNLVLASIRVVGLNDPALNNGALFENLLMGAIRRSTRNFDVVVKLNEDTYGILFLDTADKITRLLESLSDLITSNAMYSKAYADGKLDILYGCSTFPVDGDSFAELYSRATNRVKLDLDKL